jgi:hypothetical protein
MSKLIWDSVLSKEGAKYMCLDDIKKINLAVTLDRFCCMKILITLFPS